MSCENHGSVKKVASLSCNETSVKTDPCLSRITLHSINVKTVEQNIIKMLKHRAKYESYWYNINSNCKNSLSTLLGLQHDLHKQIMHEMNMFCSINKQCVPKQKLFESWLLINNIEGTLQVHRKKGSGRQIFLLLGNSRLTSNSLSNQIKNNMQSPKIDPLKHLLPAIEWIKVETRGTETPMECNAPDDAILMEDDVSVDDLDEPNDAIEREVRTITNVVETTALPFDDDMNVPTTPTVTFEDDLDIMLRKNFPKKSEYVDEPDWYEDVAMPSTRDFKSKSSKPIMTMIKCMCKNNASTAVELLQHMLTNKFDQNNVVFSVEHKIALNVKSYFDKLTNDCATKKRKSVQDEMDIAFKAAAHEEVDVKSDVMKHFGVSNFRSYRNLDVSGRTLKKRKDNVFEVAKQCVDEFVHSEVCTRIDANQFKFKKIGDEKHPIRVWNHMHWQRRLEVFQESEICEKHKAQHPLLTIGKTRFRQFICPCMQEPRAESCVNIPMDELSNIMFSLASHIRTHTDLRNRLKSCTCPFHTKHKEFEKLHSQRPEEILKLTLCARQLQPHLMCSDKIPKIHHPNCVTDACANCNTISINQCPTHSTCIEETKCMLWQEAARAGGKTQLEPVENYLATKDIITKLEKAIEVGRKTYVLSQWNDHMRKIDCEESNKDTTVILTDFSPSLDLRARQTDNCSVNNHAVLDTFCLLNNFRKVKLDNDKYTNLCDTHCFCYFGCSMSSGKKNDHAFHIACVDETLKKDSVIRVERNIGMRKKTIVWTDNCPTQHKCRQNFLHIAKKRNESFIHKFATKYHFKGPWDGCGKRLKKHMWDSELESNRAGGAFQCYLRCSNKFNTKNKNPIWMEWEMEGNSNLLDKTTFKHDAMTIGFVTDSLSEYDKLVADGYDNITHADRSKVLEDLNPVKDTAEFFQVMNRPNNPSNEHILRAHRLVCSCKNCRIDTTCPYYGIRAMVDHTLKLKETHLAQDDDTLRNTNINKLTINMLKSELLYRGLSTTHSKKEQLVQRLSSFLSSKNE